MTPETKSPWPTPPASTGHALDNSPLAIIERDQAITDGIRRGLVRPNFAQASRMAVAAGIRAGLVKLPLPPAPPAPASHDATAGQPDAPGGGSKV